MAATVYFNEVDLPALGIYPTIEPNWRDAPKRSFPTVGIPGRHGAVVAADPTVEPRQLTIPFAIRPATASTATRLAAERQLMAAAARGLVQITFDDDVNPPVAIDGLYVDATIKPVGHPIQGPVANASVTFLCPDPTWRDVTATVATFNATPQAIVVGTSPGGGIIRLAAPSWSADVVDPVLSYYAASRALRGSVTFQTTLTAGTKYLELDLDRWTATLYASGVASNAVPLITAGDLFAIDPGDADPLTGSYPLLGVTATSGTPSGTWIGPRRWL